MFKNTTLALCVMIGCLMAPSLSVLSAQDVVHFPVVLDGAQAGTTSAGTGMASVLVNANTGDVVIAGSFTGLEGSAVNAFLGRRTRTFSIDPGNAGNFSGTPRVTNTIELAEVLAGLSHINIESTAFPSGEIRGNLLAENRTGLFLELGDVNRDDFIDFLDISRFIAVLASGEYQIEADMDQNAIVNFLDIAPFIERLNQ